MLTFEPKTHEELYDEPRFLEVALPGESDFADERDAAEERERIDDQIIAALVSP